MRGTWWRAVCAVGAAFFGVRGAQDLAQDVRQLRPWMVIAVALALGLVFVFSLVLLVRWVAP